MGIGRMWDPALPTPHTKAAATTAAMRAELRCAVMGFLYKTKPLDTHMQQQVPSKRTNQAAIMQTAIRYAVFPPTCQPLLASENPLLRAQLSLMSSAAVHSSASPPAVTKSRLSLGF